MRRPLHNTTSLPKELRDQLGITENEQKRRRNSVASRKERRKAERSDKKSSRTPIRKRERELEGGEFESEADDVPVKRGAASRSEGRKAEKAAIKPSKKAPKQVELSEDEDGDSSGEEPVERMSKVSKGVKDRLATDDAEIAALEKALGMKGKKKLPKAFREDGLDELLGGVDSDSDTESKKREREGAEWLQSKRRKAQGLELDESENGESDIGSGDEGMDFMDGEEGDDDDEDDLDGDDGGFDDDDASTKPPKVRENPYVAPVAPDANRQKYIPPSLRAPAASESESLVRLRRQAQGLLNRLSEANLTSILGETEKLYREYPRQNVTSTLTTLLLGLICDRSSLQDTFIVLHAGFIAAIYKVMGMGFGAELVQKIVETFDQSGDAEKTFEGKEALNLVSLISQLYSFQVVGSGLMFDYIRIFLSDINEHNTELLLKIIRTSGPQLRQDDPSSLKDIVLMIQPAVAQVGEDALSVRTKFMIDTITDLKNNRMKTGVAASTIMSEHVTRMRKILGSLNSRALRATEPLRVGRMDILNSNKKGKWWLVGASWKEEPTVDPANDTNELSLPDEEIDDDIIGQDVDLLQLARAHRMNTDVRRAIFIAIMSATDYRDAHLRIVKLRLKRNQELEVPRVLIHCAAAEDAHNPYYTLIARKMCSERKIKVAFMFALWDVFKRMGEKGDDEGDCSDGDFDNEDEDGAGKLNTSSIVNLAKMYGTLVADGGLTLGILKILNFAYLQTKTSTFVELLLVTIILQTQQKDGKRKKLSKKNEHGIESTEDQRDEKALESIFLKCSETPQVIKGLIFFIRKTVSKTDIVTSKKDRKIVHWGCKVATRTLRSIS